ncbi:SCO family protein (plasmid) [Martelella lutilitoris]|jgi:protein SCO1/2|uniref:SCO family protein n=1 Tax=Martelella lutilitoris TaxID=2583532 RepID=A0A7T7HPL7_9HYPH|nr:MULTISPECIES: SCO family protein [Martelella]MAM12219.1 SCO family protein [Rhizobiaceae bacterium]QQM33056.1 SCO family protein [Martelella lutilitoris]QRX65207.1 SCO family protein [Dysgonomonadaceae bacterium zrk40]VVT35391.1 Electron transport protein SCO1/SenC [Hoeflea sp. EC-HK425]|tara:strand:+ start:777 stop:1370 length:594 start_codon:yes stop_codon:yes gene_type:complete
MRLKVLQKMLWAAVALAIPAYGALHLLDERAETPVAEVSFRPTFSLLDAEGRVRMPSDFAGKHLLVFFGFTNCPDVCPTTLAEVAQVMEGLGDDAGKVQPLFISIDPTRDRSLELAEYTAAFHPSILGLAGDEAQTRAAARSFRIFYEREDSSGAPDGYTMAHSAALYLIGPDGNWLRQFSYGTPASEILNDLRQRL